MLKWLFFDMGSTLIDESECTEYRLEHLAKQKNAPPKETLVSMMRKNAEMNRLPYKDTAKELGLLTVKWPVHLEKLFPEVPSVLSKLSEKYKLGIIANQSAGAYERLKGYGIADYFDVIVSSAERGVSKPSREIFELALSCAGCEASEACMIGDRLDNDIEPAAKIGMKTVWVKVGEFAFGDPKLIFHEPDFTVDKIEEILNIF